MDKNEKKKNKKSWLSIQVILIICFAALALTFFIVWYFVLPNLEIFKEQKQTVPLVNEYGDVVSVRVLDKQTGEDIYDKLKNMLDKKEENVYDVKKGDGKETLLTFRKDNVKVETYPFIFPEIPVENISNIKVTNLFDSFTIGIMQKTPYIVGAENNIYNQNNLYTLLFNCRYMLADKYVENPGELSEYGLDEENRLATIEILEKDGKKTTVYLGSMLSDGRFYMKHADKEHIYLMDNGISILMCTTLDLISPVVVKSISQQESYYLDKFSLNKNGEPFFSCRILSDEEKVGTLINQRHVMTYPEQIYVLDTESVYQMFEQAASFTGVAVIENNVSDLPDKDEVLVSYGLDIPLFEIDYSYGGADYSFSVGAKTEDGMYYYVYSPYQDTVVIADVSKVEFFGKELIDLYEDNIFQYNIDNVSKLELKYDGNTYSYILSGDGKELKVKEENSGKEIDVASFRRMYMSVLGITIGGYSNVEGSAENLSHMLTVSATLRSGEKLIYEFYSTSAVSCYMKLDGKGGFETDRRTIEKVIENSNNLMAGIAVEAEY